MRNMGCDISEIHLSHGSHATREEGMDIMEAVAYAAGEPHTDRPRCACPVIGRFLQEWDYSLKDLDRNRLLRQYIFRLIGTRTTRKIEERRKYMAADWFIRAYAPTWMDLTPDLRSHAASMRSVPEIVTGQGCVNCADIVSNVLDAVWAAIDKTYNVLTSDYISGFDDWASTGNAAYMTVGQIWQPVVGNVNVFGSLR